MGTDSDFYDRYTVRDFTQMLIKMVLYQGPFSFCWVKNLKFVIFKVQIRNNYKNFVTVGIILCILTICKID